MNRQLLLTLLFTLFAHAALAGGERHGQALVWSKEGVFPEVKGTLLDTITSRGLVLSYVSHAQAMLDRTAAATGATTRIYDHAEIFLFCKAGLSQKLVAANPHNIVLCPYSISLYSLVKEPGKVYLAIPATYASDPQYADIKELLTGIISEVVEW